MLRCLNGEKHYKLENGGHKIIGTLDKKWFDKNSDYHREDGPAHIEYYKNGNIKNEDYFINGINHREDGPAYTVYYENGNIEFKDYYLNGTEHKKYIPSQVDYNEDNSLKSEFIINKKWSYCKI
jgi:antitoxin component YwqK of YwqJK toxin-antitoxin module